MWQWVPVSEIQCAAEFFSRALKGSFSFRAGQLDGNRKWVKLSSSTGLYAKRELILINAGCLYENAKSVFEIRGHTSHIVRLRFWLFVVHKHILVFPSPLLIYNAREAFLSKVLSFLSTLDLENLPLQWVLKTKTCPYSKIRLSGFRGFDKVTHKGVLQTENKTRRESGNSNPLSFSADGCSVVDHPSVMQPHKDVI